MDIQPTSNQQPISDDQELAKVLAGINQQADEAADTQGTPAVPPAEPPTEEPVVPTPQPSGTPTQEPEQEVAPQQPEPASVIPTPPVQTPSPLSSSAPVGDLDAIKQEALGELRPLVDKLDVPPEEKFDTYLLLLRSTDDKDLIGPAHEAARNITDEARRAQALLDIIKEIDYLSGGSHPA